MIFFLAIATAQVNTSTIVTAYVTRYNTQGIMANGDYVHDGAIACPRSIPLETHVEIDGQIYECADRTNKRYDGRFDIYDPSPTSELLKWGKRLKTVEILN